MHEQHSSGCPTAAPCVERDPQVVYEKQQALILDELLSEHPALMTYEEACLASVRDPEDRGEADTFEHAVRGLGWAGLIRRQGGLLVPVRPARQMAALGFRLG